MTEATKEQDCLLRFQDCQPNSNCITIHGDTAALPQFQLYPEGICGCCRSTLGKSLSQSGLTSAAISQLGPASVMLLLYVQIDLWRPGKGIWIWCRLVLQFYPLLDLICSPQASLPLHSGHTHTHALDVAALVDALTTALGDGEVHILPSKTPIWISLIIAQRWNLIVQGQP